MKGTAWSVEQRIEAAIAWLITGSTVEAEKLCNIPARTIRAWMQESWWDDVLDQAKGIKQKEIDALWTGLIHQATEQLKDRIKDGDEYVDRHGNTHRVPVKAKDLAAIIERLVDKRAMARGQATSRTERISVEEKLDQIKGKLGQMDQEQDGEKLH